MPNVSITGVTLDRVSCTPLCLDLSAHADASPRTISLVSATHSPPPPPPHSLSLLLTLFDIFPSRTFSQSLPAFLLPCPPLSRSSCCSLLHSLQTRLLVYSLPARSVSHSFPPPPLQLSFSHYFTFTHSGTPSATHMLPTTAKYAHALIHSNNNYCFFFRPYMTVWDRKYHLLVTLSCKWKVKPSPKRY